MPVANFAAQYFPETGQRVTHRCVVQLMCLSDQAVDISARRPLIFHLKILF
jgi:hypothetical protein